MTAISTPAPLTHSNLAKKAPKLRKPAPKTVKAKPAAPAKQPVAKPVAKPAAKPVVKPLAKPLAKPVAKAPTKAVEKSLKPLLAKKPKLVRDSFTLPQADHDLIKQCKKIAVTSGRETKKSEVIRAAMQSFAAMSQAQQLAAYTKLESIAVGRPKAK